RIATSVAISVVTLRPGVGAAYSCPSSGQPCSCGIRVSRNAMAGRGTTPDFVEALARGLDILACFGEARPAMTLAEVAAETGLPRPTARRLLLTLAELGYVRTEGPLFLLTPQVLRLGIAYVGSLGLWDIARPHLMDLVAQTHESSSMAQLD